MRHRWKHSPQDLHELYAQGQSLEQVGAVEGVSGLTIRRLFRKHGLQIRRGGRPPGTPQRGRALTAKQQALAIQLYQQGQSLAAIARQLGCSRSPVTRCIRSEIPQGERRTYTSTVHKRTKDGKIQCVSCLSYKLPTEFYNNSTAASGKTARCKSCTRLRNLHYTYNLQPAEYQQLVQEQAGLCAICGSPADSDRNRQRQALCVDHDHQTQAVRGLLCVACNHALGLMADSPEWLDRAAQYLRDNDAQG